jgi:hypothetical protein
MTPEQRELGIWGGATLAIIVAGSAVLAWRGGDLDAVGAKARQLHGDYLKLYHPDKPGDGVPAAEAERDLVRAKDLQGEQLEKADGLLVADLPGSYAAAMDLTSAGHQVYADHQTIHQTAQMKHVALPASLPYDAPLDADAAKRALQLGNLYLYRAVLDQCIRVGVAKVDAVTPGKPEGDPTGSYVRLTCDFEVEGSYDSVMQLMQALLETQRAGIGLAALAMDAPSDRVQRMRFTASLITPTRPGFSAEAPRKPAETAPTTRPSPRGRLGG